MVLSLGWHDAAAATREVIKKVVVSFHRIEVHKDHDPTTPHSELQLKYGVNGRWFALFEEAFSNQSKVLGLGQQVEIYLHEDDYVAINCHGMEEDLVGGVMRESTNDRTLKNGNRAYTWSRDIDQPDNDHASRVAADLLEKMAKTLRQENDPLGIIDSGYNLNNGDATNPLQVSKLMELTGGPGRVFSRYADGSSHRGRG